MVPSVHATVVGAAATSPAARAGIAKVWYSMMINLQKSEIVL